MRAMQIVLSALLPAVFLATSVSAETVRMVCSVVAGGTTYAHIVDVDLATRSVTYQIPLLDFRWTGPADITDNLIRWRWGNYGEYWQAIDRNTGQMMSSKGISSPCKRAEGKVL